MFGSDDDDKELPDSFKSPHEKKEHKKTEKAIKRTAQKYPGKTNEIEEKIIKAANLREEQKILMKTHKEKKKEAEEAGQEAQQAEQEVREGIKQENSKRLKDFKKNTDLPDF